MNNVDTRAAFQAAADASGDPKAIAKIAPGILTACDAATAYALVKQFNQNSTWLPEALVLFTTDGLGMHQRRDMTHAILPSSIIFQDKDLKDLSDCHARLGRYGFSFPQWRFVAQGLSGPSLLETFGMTKLERPTDVRQPHLPKSDLQRDLYGSGFIKEDNNWTLEYRRAYILCSSRRDTATIVIRNSSYFFGRDRLPEPVYVSWESLSSEALKNINAESFSGNGPFIEWREAMQSKDSLDLSEKIRRIQKILDCIDRHDMKLSLWLQEDGKSDLGRFIEKNYQMQKERGSEIKIPFYLCGIDPAMPPWFPLKSIPATPDIFYKDDKKSWAPLKMVLLSAPQGDLPIKPT